MDFIDVMAIAGYFLRLLGALVFGVAAGWLVLRAVKPEAYHWAVTAAVIVSLFLTFALVGYWVEGGGTLGAFGLGAGGAILIWPLAAGSASDEEETSTRKK
jgi:peptidoglycan/LPS O-acetylase OafA/YrhL